MPSYTSDSADISSLTADLREIANVDDAYIGSETASALTIYVLAREHGLVLRDDLLALEDRFSTERGKELILTIRAHQGRDLKAMTNATLLFGLNG